MVDIRDGLIILTLDPEAASLLARACVIATSHVGNAEAQLLQAYTGLFKAATIAATCQQRMTFQACDNADEFVRGLFGESAATLFSAPEGV